MVRLHSTVTTPAMNVTQLPELVAAILDRLRSIDFDRGVAVHPTKGTRLGGLANTSGAHPRPGSEYVVVTTHTVLPAPSAKQQAAFEALTTAKRAPTKQAILDHHEQRRLDAVNDGTLKTAHDTIRLRLHTDDARLFTLKLVADEDDPMTATLHIDNPLSPTHLRVEAVTPSTSKRFFSGDISIDGVAVVAAIGSNAEAITISGQHRRGRGRIAIQILESSSTDWTLDVTVTARGTGWFRPVAAVGGLLGKSTLQRGLDDELRADGPGLGSVLEEFRTSMAGLDEKSAAAVAADLVDFALSSVVENLPTRDLR